MLLLCKVFLGRLWGQATLLLLLLLLLLLILLLVLLGRGRWLLSPLLAF